MKLSSANFLTHIKALVTGGGRDSKGNTKLDSGFLVDSKNLIGDSVLATSVTRIAASDGFPILSAAATITALAAIGFTVPRDYDEASDILIVSFVANAGGATDTPTITLDPDKKTVGSASVQMTAFTGSSLTTAAVSATATRYTIVLTGNTLLRNQLVKFTLTTGAHTTDTVQLLDFRVTYASTLVSYHETDGTTPLRGNALR